MKRKRKQQQSDFPKKKQKLGKGKRPPENATQVVFKSQSIYVPGQFEKSTGPTTHRKLGLQDLLRQISHPKSSVCRDALNGLRELFIDTQLLIDNLSTVLNGLVTVLFNNTESVHHSLYLLLKHICQVTPSQVMSPYLECMLAGLKCAITHLNQIIRLSGLKIIDLIITHYPRLLQSHIIELLPYYIPLVSTSPSSSKNTLVSAQANKLLVLKQILNFLTLVSPNSTIACKPCPPIINIAEQCVSISSSSIDLYEYLTSSSLLLKLSSCKPICRTNNNDNINVIQTTNLTGFNNQLLQSLLEYWIELSPLVTGGTSPGGSGRGGKKKPKSHEQLIELVDVLIQLLCLLLESSGSESLSCERDYNQIITHFLPHFPFPSHYGTVNIRLAYLLILTEFNSLDTVYNYLSKRMTSLSQITQSVTILTKILSCLSNRSEKGLEIFYSFIVKFFLSIHVSSSAYQNVLLFIEELLDRLVKSDDNFSTVFKDSFLYPYLSSLPNLLLKQSSKSDISVTQLVLKITTCALSMKIKTVEQSLVLKFHHIYGQNGFIYTCPHSLLNSMVYLISHLSSLTQANLSDLSVLVNSNHLPTPVTVALIYLVHNKLLSLHDNESNPTIFGLHVSFLYSLLIGYTDNTLRQISPVQCVIVVQRDHLNFVEPLKSCQLAWEDINKVIINCLMNSGLSESRLLYVLKPVLTQLMMWLTIFPLDTVYRLVSLFSQCSSYVSPCLYQVISPLLLMCLNDTNASKQHLLITKCSQLIRDSSLIDMITNTSLNC